MKPVRRIATEEDLEKFIGSETYLDLVDFVLALNNSIKGHDLGLSEPVSPQITSLISILESVTDLVRKHPAQDSESRFGKPEFRDFHDDLERILPDLLRAVLPNDLIASYLDELEGYLSESFGNRTRLDYGSGHELNFICFLLCLRKLNVIQIEDYTNLTLGVFNKYLMVMRDIQREYWLEPAGSHGVWGLDDYHFLPFLFGSGQLIDHKYLRPMSIHDLDIVDMYKDSNFYFRCISFINSVKTASLRWHSPMLDDISGVKKWSKVNEGMVKMYRAEVLGKLPIVQHFLFGSLLPAPEGVTAAQDIGDEIHVHCWADCCGIRVPSAIAANAKGSHSSSSQDSVDSRGTGHILRMTAAVPLD